MSRFIKLTNMVINTSKIIKINTYTDGYIVHTSDINFSGLSLFSVGMLSSTDSTIRVLKTESPADYQVITDWIANIKNE